VPQPHKKIFLGIGGAIGQIGRFALIKHLIWTWFSRKYFLICELL
jgi:hypothetical protein